MGNERNGKPNTWIEGTSTLNQRIESFWSHSRKQCLEFWICIFHDFKENGQYTGDFVDVNLMRFCFMGLLQVSELSVYSIIWYKDRESRKFCSIEKSFQM